MPDSTMPTTETRDAVVDYLRSQYLGPAGGREETILTRPDRSYLVGTLYPRGEAATVLDGDEFGDDVPDEALDDSVELSNAWHPASAAISFLHDGTALTCSVAAARYEDVPDGGWRRIPMADRDIPLARTAEGISRPTVLEGRARLFVIWRRHGDAWLTTVALENIREQDDPEAQPATEDCLFQAELECRVEGGRVLPYPSSADLSEDPEDQELRLLYRHRRVYGAGHGCSVTWTGDDAGNVTTVRSEMMPATRVPGVTADSTEASAVRNMAYLADESVPVAELRGELLGFVDGYADWVAERVTEAESLPEHADAAARLLDRMHSALARMRQGVEALTGEDDRSSRWLLAFRLANAAMRDQFLQSQHQRTATGVRVKPLTGRPEPTREPSWKPFQLAFQLLSIASTSDADHADREVVDLIWFPTGGGKTEAYLGLAAFEMIRRRLERGVQGGGTAVLTRYTLRLLTTQQLQRAAALICALQRLRTTHPALQGTYPFTIGLWVGGDTTPNDYPDAHRKAVELRQAQRPESFFQLQACPWCATPLFPDRRLEDDAAYGFRSTKNSFELFCPHPDCAFHDRLPMQVVDQAIFDDPPTMVVATVDKFARLPWVERAGTILGHGNVTFDPPGLVIQDELHLLSGPLGTTVALYESAIQGLLGWDGRPAKIVASTATIRAADHQVRNLYGRDVVLFPPSGLSADDSHFARVDEQSPGRLYVGLMPQAHTQSFAMVLTCVALLQAPIAPGLEGGELDAYWTLVAYHNSLRELGRTVTIARDDVDAMLRARARDGAAYREIGRDGVIELTSNVRSARLVEFLERLERGVGEEGAVDLVATTNMLSVGIDISRLGLMLMNGQPKTTSEYIQATSRVGRADVPGLVVTLLRASKPRDRSHYENFRGYHEALYRYVEPTSVTPWSLASRERALHAALTILVRHAGGLSGNADAGSFRRDQASVRSAVGVLHRAVERADADEVEAAVDELDRLVGEWERRAQEAAAAGDNLRYQGPPTSTEPVLLKDFGEKREGWETMHSMRSVDRQVRVLAIGEQL